MGILDRLLGRQRLIEELESLRWEIRRLRREKSSLGGMRSITGLQEKVIQLDEQLRIEYINSPLAHELGSTKEKLIGQPLVQVDRFPWGHGLLAELVDRARALPTGEDGEVSVERSHVDGTGREKFHRVKVSVAQGKPQILIEDVTNLRNLEQIFQRYVSPTVIEKMKQLTERDFFRAERSVLTVLFADLRGFTAASQNMSPEEVRNTINDYLEAMINVADRHEACVDKVVADEVMVLFGAPIPDADHAAKSLIVALEMQRAQDLLCARWRSQGRPEIHMGIGINTGEMVVGNIGSAKRMDYTVIGHHVNVASRLCNNAKPREVLLSADTYAAVQASANPIQSQVEFYEAGEIQAKGISAPLRVVGARARA